MKKIAKAMYGKSMMKAGGMTSGKCPSGYTLVNGKCTDSKGNTISAPYISDKGAFYPDEKSLTSGCAKNPNGPGCKAIIDKMTPEQKAKIKGIQKLGGSTKKMKTGGMINANKSVTASKVAKGRSGGTSTAPKTAIPKAQMGGMAGGIPISERAAARKVKKGKGAITKSYPSGPEEKGSYVGFSKEARKSNSPFKSMKDFKPARPIRKKGGAMKKGY